MKASKFSDAQQAFILKQGAEGMPVAEICRKAGISQATYFNHQAAREEAQIGIELGQHLSLDIAFEQALHRSAERRWKKKYDGMTPPEMRRLKQLEDENGKLRKLVADLSLDREMLQDVIRRKI